MVDRKPFPAVQSVEQPFEKQERTGDQANHTNPPDWVFVEWGGTAENVGTEENGKHNATEEAHCLQNIRAQCSGRRKLTALASGHRLPNGSGRRRFGIHNSFHLVQRQFVVRKGSRTPVQSGAWQRLFFTRITHELSS